MYNVAYCFDKNFVQHFCAAVTSAILNFSRSPTELHFHLIVDQLSPPLSDFLNNMRLLFGSQFTVYVVGESEDSPLNRIPLSLRNMHYTTIATYFRLLLPDLIGSDVETVLYLDADTICVKDVSKLLDQDLGQSTMAMVLDPKSEKFAKHHGIADYFNAGVALISLKKWRENDLVSKCFSYLESPSTPVALADQCAINVVLNGRIKKLDAKWNRFTYHSVPENFRTLNEIRSECSIVHFNSAQKPWHSWYQNPLGKLYWLYLDVSPWNAPELNEPATVNEHVMLARKLKVEGKVAEANEINERIVAHFLKTSVSK